MDETNISHDEENQNNFEENSRYGWVKIYRTLKDQFHGRPDLFALVTWIFLSVDRTDKWAGKKQIRKAGRLICTVSFIGNFMNMERMSVSRKLRELVGFKIISLKTSNKNTIIQVINWNTYQSSDEKLEQQMSIKRASNEQQMSTIQELKKGRKKELKKGGYAKTAFDTPLAPPENVVWESYSKSYERMYGTKPLQTAKQRKLVRALIKEAGEHAAGIAGFYPTCQVPFYISKAHILEFCIEDVEKINTAYQQKITRQQRIG